MSAAPEQLVDAMIVGASGTDLPRSALFFASGQSQRSSLAQTRE